ncbi:MAG TPA: sulfotransferase domain-containing protein [Rhizomicrobium sp.]|jgi:hypothetical protein|nr:sulfotransferase domain-containing protein [Rhizomicrobium sp.]
MSGRLVVIASHPKSGNTWVRIFIERLRHGSHHPLNRLGGSIHGILRRLMFDEVMQVNAADLLAEELETLEPLAWREAMQRAAGDIFVKTHEMARCNRRGEWIFPPDGVRAVIHLVRHPFDVAISTASHFSAPIENAVAFLVQGGSPPSIPASLPETLPQVTGNWSTHARSWLDGPYNTCCVRYEDLLARAVPEFQRIAAAAGFPAGASEIAATVEACRFDRLQAEEKSGGFPERVSETVPFFRAGRSGTWQGILNEGMCQAIVMAHGAMMKRLGYGADGSVLPLPSS